MSLTHSASETTKSYGPKCSTDLDTIRIIVKYRNYKGRVEVLNYSNNLHYDFHEFDNIICVTIPKICLKNLEIHPDIENVAMDGNVCYCKSKMGVTGSSIWNSFY